MIRLKQNWAQEIMWVFHWSLLTVHFSAIFSTIDSTYGRLDILINNAGKAAYNPKKRFLFLFNYIIQMMYFRTAFIWKVLLLSTTKILKS